MLIKCLVKCVDEVCSMVSTPQAGLMLLSVFL